MNRLIDVDRVFQPLIAGLNLPGTVAADLDVDSIDHVPFITHSSTIQQTANGPGLWACTLVVTVFIDASDATFPLIQDLYDGIHAWGTPPFGIVPNVAGIEEVVDVEAFTRQGKGVPMLNKLVTPYVGVFTLTLRNI